MPEHTAAPSEQTAPMRLAKILDSFIPGMHDTPCRIAIFTDGRKIKVFEKVYFRRPAFDPPLPQLLAHHPGQGAARRFGDVRDHKGGGVQLVARPHGADNSNL